MKKNKSQPNLLNIKKIKKIKQDVSIDKSKKSRHIKPYPNSNSNLDIKSQNLSSSIESSPKNVNSFREFLLKNPSTKLSDLEWVFRLRNYQNTPKVSSRQSAPGFYDIDLDKFKEKIQKDNKINNCKPSFYSYQDIYHVTKRPLNASQFFYETNLRFDMHKEDSSEKKGKIPWNSSAITPTKSQSIVFNTLLPPLLSVSKLNADKLKDFTSRPVLPQKNKVIMSNGVSVVQNKCQFDPDKSLRNPPDHFPSSRYSNEYKIKNVNLLRNGMKLFSSTNYSQWQCDLREYKNKKNKVGN